MGLIKNAINFGNGFNIGAVAPIDSRMRVELLSDLTTVWTAAIPAYKGMIVTVMETSDVYVLKDVDNYTNIDSWVKLGSASAAADGAADALTQAKAYTDQEVKELADGAVNTNTSAIAILKGDAETDGSVAKAVADAKKELLGNANEGYKTFGELEGKIIASAAELADVQEDVDNFFKDADFAGNAKDTLRELQEYINTDAEGALAMSEAIADNKTAIEAEVVRAKAAEKANTDAIAKLNGDAKTDGSVAKAVADAKKKLEGEINNKSQIVDVTSLFTERNTMTGYTMQELANSHLVYRHDNGPNGTSSVQVTMVAGSAGNSTVVIDDTTTIPSFGNYCTLIFEMHSEGILTQYVAYVEYNNNTFTTTKVNSYVLATQKSIDTLTNKVNTKQDTISDLTTIRSGAALGATALQSIPEEYVTDTELSAVEDSLQSSKQDNISDLTTIRSGAALGASSVQIVDVTNLFTNGGELGGYTMQELANSHLVYKDKATSGPNGTSSVQVTMVAGSASNSTAVIDDTTTMPTFGNHFTLIFEIYSEQDDKYILTQYLARVGNTGMTSNLWTTSSVEHHILVTQDSINTLTTEVNKKQNTISDLETIRSGARLGATSVQMIDVTSLFTEGNSMSGYTLSDLAQNKLYHSNGNTVKYVGYGDSAISPNTNEANLVMESFDGAVRNIAIAHIIFDGSTLTTDSVKTYSSNVFVMRVSQVDYDTMKAAGTLDENTLYVIAEITE